MKRSKFRIFLWVLGFALWPVLWGQVSLEQSIRVLEERILAEDLEKQLLLDSIELLRLADIQDRLTRMGFPGPGEVIRHDGFALTYDEFHEQAKWVAHVILPQIREGREGRTNRFLEDPKISTGSAQEQDYFTKVPKEGGGFKYSGFGYDRGHIAASADFKWSKRAIAASYYYSNMSPQRAALNRGRWAELEGLMREVTLFYDTTIFVVAGPLLHDSLPKIPQSVNGLSVPYWYYKVAYNPRNREAIAFIMPNESCPNPVFWYAVSVDSVERLTGFRFFPTLADTHAVRIKRTVSISPWQVGKKEGEVLPLPKSRLPRGAVNTKDLKAYNPSDNPRVMVCGTVVSATRSKKDHVFLNFDTKFPNSVFSVTIWASNVPNFSYAPETFLMNREICVSGNLVDSQGTPGVQATHEKQIIFLDEDSVGE
jgi:endonuclease G